MFNQGERVQSAQGLKRRPPREIQDPTRKDGLWAPAPTPKKEEGWARNFAVKPSICVGTASEGGPSTTALAGQAVAGEGEAIDRTEDGGGDLVGPEEAASQRLDVLASDGVD
jgi:hypothetical protein